jgi:hypothetical protein
MSKLNELNKSIVEIEEQAAIFKNNNVVLSKVAEIKDSLDLSIEKITKNNEGFSSIVDTIKSELENFSSQIGAMQKANDSFIDDLSTTNKKVIRELEEGIVSKLDRLSTEIQNALRSEVNQLEKSVKLDISERFVQLNENQKIIFKELDTNLKQFIELNTKSVKNLIFILIAVSAITMAIVIGVILK